MEIYSFDDTHVITPYSNNTGFFIDTEFINIRDVCTGWFELAVFLSLILATIDVCWKKRILGAIILIPLFLVFNLLEFILLFFHC
jgi:exosortase/archaeosortase